MSVRGLRLPLCRPQGRARKRRRRRARGVVARACLRGGRGWRERPRWSATSLCPPCRSPQREGLVEVSVLFALFAAAKSHVRVVSGCSCCPGQAATAMGIIMFYEVRVGTLLMFRCATVVGLVFSPRDEQERSRPLMPVRTYLGGYCTQNTRDGFGSRSAAFRVFRTPGARTRSGTGEG